MTDTAPDSEKYKIPHGGHKAVRAYLTPEGLLAPVGDPFNRIAAPCPKGHAASDPHTCILWRQESWFKCDCGVSGDYWQYVALREGITLDAALQLILQRMELDALWKLKYADEGQAWHDKKVALLLKRSMWEPGTKAQRGETLELAEWEQPGPIRSAPGIPKRKVRERQREVKSILRTSERALRNSVSRCIRVLRNTDNNAVLLHYRLGYLLQRLEWVHKKGVRGGTPGSRWSRYLRRITKCSDRYIRNCRRVFEAVEFVWQLEPFRTVDEVLRTISKARHPTTKLATVSGSWYEHEFTVERNLNRSEYQYAVNIQLRSGRVGYAFGELDPVRPQAHLVEAAARSLQPMDTLLAACAASPDYATSVEPLLETLQRLFALKGIAAPDIVSGINEEIKRILITGTLPVWLQADAA